MSVQSVLSTAPRDHHVRFYETDQALFETTGHYLLEGFALHEGLIVVASSAHLAGFERVLRAGQVDVATARARGQLLTQDAEETLAGFMVGNLADGHPDAAAFVRVVGGLVERASAGGQRPRLRVYGEMVDILFRRGNGAAAIELEGLWNELADRRPFQLRCAYLLDAFDHSHHDDVFRNICDLHSSIAPTESYDGTAPLDGQRRQIAELQQRARALETEITARRQIEQTLREREHELREIARRKDEFLAVLSHELRNPLAPILTSIAIMEARGGAESRRERDVIRRQATHLSRLIEDLLDLSRVTQGKIVLRKEPTELGAVVQRAVEMANPLIEARGHRLDVKVPDEGLVLDADPTRLAQVVANLLTNAAKFTAPGGHIKVTAQRSDESLVLEVQDDGVGIVADVLPIIFDSFVQGGASPSLDRPQGGLGIGLTLVRSLTQLHGGSVSAYSEGAGRGSLFVVRLPALPPAGQHAPSKVTAFRERPLARRIGPPKRVLVADDNVDFALGLADLIRDLGYEVAVVHDGPAALALAKEWRPAAALVDIGLPGMDGFELGRALRESADQPLKLIAVTGYGQEKDRARSHESGFDLHLLKPVDFDAVSALLDRLWLEPQLS
jgi:signal transduction histidine kinase/CheY-like chemotaxis protein